MSSISTSQGVVDLVRHQGVGVGVAYGRQLAAPERLPAPDVRVSAEAILRVAVPPELFRLPVGIDAGGRTWLTGRPTPKNERRASPSAALHRPLGVVHANEQSDAEVRRMAERNGTTNRSAEREAHVITAPLGVAGVTSIASRCMHSCPLGALLVHLDVQASRIVSLMPQFDAKLLFGRFSRPHSTPPAVHVTRWDIRRHGLPAAVRAVSEAGRRRHLRIQRHEPHGPRISCARLGERELKLLFGGLQDGELLIVREWLVAPDKESCCLACLTVKENTESSMWVPRILQR